MLSEFDTLFDPTDPPFIGQISKPYANEALNLFLHSEVDTAMANNLETYQGGCSAANQTSGIPVLRYLQRRYAPLDDVDATKNLEGMTRCDNERMNNFNSRFNAQFQYARSCGIRVLPRDQLPQYLRTLRRCDAPDIHYKVRRYAERIEMGESFTLSDVQDGLQQCDDEAQRDKRAQERSTGRNQQATQHASSASNASTESGPYRLDPSSVGVVV